MDNSKSLTKIERALTEVPFKRALSSIEDFSLRRKLEELEQRITNVADRYKNREYCKCCLEYILQLFRTDQQDGLSKLMAHFIEALQYNRFFANELLAEILGKHYSLIGEILDKLKILQKGVKVFREEDSPVSKDEISMIELLERESTAFNKHQKALVHFQEGNLAYRDKDYKVALEKYEVSISLDDTFIPSKDRISNAHNNVGLCHWKKCEKDPAITHFNKAISYNPDYSTAYRNLADVFLFTGKIKEAIENYKKTINLSPNDSKAYSNLGYALSELGQNDDGIAQCKKALEINPRCDQAYRNWAKIIGHLGQYEEAIEKCKEVIEINPRNELAYSSWSGCLARMGGDEEDVIAKSKKAIEINPSSFIAYTNWGTVLNELGRNGEEIEKYKKAIEINPSWYMAYGNLGKVLVDLGKYEEAIEKYQKAIEINSDNFWVYSSWGHVLEMLERDEEAIEKYEKALQINPNYEYASKNLKALLKKLGK